MMVGVPQADRGGSERAARLSGPRECLGTHEDHELVTDSPPFLSAQRDRDLIRLIYGSGPFGAPKIAEVPVFAASTGR
jgi:hypothetical protein